MSGREVRTECVEAAESLRAVVAAVDGGEVEASTAERAYLAGAAEAFELAAGRDA